MKKTFLFAMAAGAILLTLSRCVNSSSTMDDVTDNGTPSPKYSVLSCSYNHEGIAQNPKQRNFRERIGWDKRADTSDTYVLKFWHPGGIKEVMGRLASIGVSSTTDLTHDEFGKAEQNYLSYFYVKVKKSDVKITAIEDFGD